jgi:hypothetical protein
VIELYSNRSPQAAMAQIANFSLPLLIEGYLTSEKMGYLTNSGQNI